MPLSARRFREVWCPAFALAITLCSLLPPFASAQDPPALILRPRVVPDPVPQVQTSCAACQPQADAYNEIARRINDLNFQLAHRRREADLQQQAIAQVEAEIAQLQSTAPSPTRDARMATARQRLDAYREQLKRDLAQAAELEKQIAESSSALAAAKAALQACEENCASAAQQSAAEPPMQASPTQPQVANISPEAREELRKLRNDLLLSDEERERQRVEAEQFDASLKAMAGDEWAAEFAAFFTSTLFDTGTPFETAYLQNMKTRFAISEERTPEQRAALSASALQNVTVAAQRAEQRRAAAESAGRDLEYTYTRDARGLIGPGYPDLPSAGDSHKTAALMSQDAHMGQLLQFRANLNIIKIGDGTVSDGSFVNFSGAQTFIRLNQINHELGVLRAAGSNAGQIAMQANVRDDARIAALETERAQLLTIDGLAPSEGLMTARAGLIDGLAGLAPSVYEAYWNWIGFKEGGLPAKYYHLPPNEAAAQYEAEQAKYENIYLTALGQSPFLGAMVDPTGSGDPIPFWQYLTSTESPWEGGRRPSSYEFVPTGTRDPAQDQVALTHAIEFLDQASMQVIDQYGTIVTTVPLLNAYGSPVFAPLRTQVINDLSVIYPNITANMGLLTSQYDAYMLATAASRMGKDLAIGGVQVGVGLVIVGFPFTAPVLVPIEIALTAGTVGLEGFRLYYAWQDLQQAEQAASVGAGASYVGVKPYQDLFKAQLVSFVLVAGTAPLATAGSLMSLEAAKNQLRLAAAATDTPPTGLTTSTDTIVDTVASTTARTAAPDFATFRGMRPDAQVAAVKGLPEEARGQLVGRLDPIEQKLFAVAWESASADAQIIALVRQGDMWLELIDGNWSPLSQATRNASDQEILARVRASDQNPRRIILSREGRQQLYEQGFGADEAGPFSTAPPKSRYEGAAGEGTFPAPGFYTSQMSQAEIDALLTKTGPLTPEEVALKADLLLNGRGLQLAFRPTDELTQAEIDALMTGADVQALFARPVSELTPAEAAMRQELLDRGFGNGGQAVVSGWNAPLTGPAPAPFPVSNPFNPFAEFGPGGAINSEGSTLHGAADSGLSGKTEAIPGRPRNPNRTALFDEPDLPPDTLIFEPFTPPAAGLLELPADLRNLLHGEPLPQSLWNVPTPTVLRKPKPFVFEPHPPLTPATGGAPPVTTNTTGAAAAGGAVPTIPLGTIVHFAPQPVPPGVVKPTQPWVPPPWMPFVTKVIPIGCRLVAGSQVPTCDAPTYVYVLNYPPNQAGTIGAALRATPGFVYGEGDVLRLVQAPDPYLSSRGSWKQPYDDQWALKQIGLGAAARDRKAAEVTVAVIDTGVAWNHVDLTPDDLWINRREIPANHKDDDGNGYVDDIVGWNFVDSNNLPWDFNGHGTLVAGIIAAGRDNGVGIAGVNPDARIMVLKAMDERGRGRASAVTEAIMYAARQGARVINLSVGGKRLTRSEQIAIEYATAQGALVVVAAGNEGIELSDYGPAGLRRALTVAATDPSDRRVTAVNFGAAIDLAAPGVDVLGPRAIGTDLLAAARVKDYKRGANIVGPDAGYIHATGTSFAAPLVAGVASLLFAANPSLSTMQVERMLLQSAKDIESPGVDPLTGYGRLDAAAALSADPDFFVEAAIKSVEVATTARGPAARVIGTADAERFAGAHIEIGTGEHPSAWTRVEGVLSKPVREGTLGEIPAATFKGSAAWTLRVVVRHANGRTREARFLLRLN